METATPAVPDDQIVDWYRLSSDEACERLDVDPTVGLSDAEVIARRERYGSNKLAEEAKEPTWKAFLRQYRDLMQLVLVGAAVVSIVAIQEVSTALVVLGLTVLNAVMGMHQEGKAAESVASLRQMLIMTANVRRNGERVQVPAEELVPGDIVGFEAGDKVSADGRLLVAATLEIEEAGLTGESTPSAKRVEAVTDPEAPLGDRVDMAYMNSQVTRGRGEMVVTATGMESEVGHISGMLSGVEQEKTPLTKQLDQLTVLITIMAAAALVLIIDPRPGAGRRLRLAVHHRDQLGHRGNSDRTAGSGDDAALDRNARVGGEGSDHQAPPIGGDVGFDLGDLFRQDRHAHAQPDDGPRARRRGPSLQRRRRGLLDGGSHSSSRRHRGRAARAVPAADGARQRRRDPRRCLHRRPDRRGARRPRRQGWARRSRDERTSTRASRKCRSTPSTS